MHASSTSRVDPRPPATVAAPSPPVRTPQLSKPTRTMSHVEQDSRCRFVATVRWGHDRQRACDDRRPLDGGGVCWSPVASPPHDRRTQHHRQRDHRVAARVAHRRVRPFPLSSPTPVSDAVETTVPRATVSDGQPRTARLSIPALGLHDLAVVPYPGKTDDARGTRIQDGGVAASPHGPHGGVGPGGLGNYQVTAHRTSSTQAFRMLPVPSSRPAGGGRVRRCPLHLRDPRHPRDVLPIASITRRAACRGARSSRCAAEAGVPHAIHLRDVGGPRRRATTGPTSSRIPNTASTR